MIEKPSPWSFCWTEEDEETSRAVELVRSMAAVRCKNKYPVGVIGREARAHYNEARSIAQAIEARRAETGTGSVHESAVHAPISQSEDQTNEPG